jgi:hypothetical protein
MCFSPSVSFGASAVLAVTGVVAINRSTTLPQKVLALVPLFFALQQCAEGFVWLSLLHEKWAYSKLAASYVFLFFAQIVWPVYMPVCALLSEHHARRRKLIIATLLAGISLAVYTSVLLALHPPVATAAMHHIHYELSFSLAHQWYYGVLYFIPAVLSLLLSSHKPLHWLGYLFFISYLLTRLVFHYYVISVWCFFGAAISVLVLVIIPRIDRAKNSAAMKNG